MHQIRTGAYGSQAKAYVQSRFYLRNPIADFVAAGVPMSFMQLGRWQVYDPSGRRKYLTADERQRFLIAADTMPPRARVLCYLLAYSGCRISEALSLTAHQIDRESGTVTIRTLKRRRLVYRAVPMPPLVIAMLASLPTAPDGRFWKMHRCTAWRRIKEAMEVAGIDGPMATCRGLRHGFGIRAVASSVPPNLIAKWMGHRSTATTAIYLDVVGHEEREVAKRMWD